MLKKYNKYQYNFRTNNCRDWNDPQYRKWKKLTHQRDGYCCQWPGCPMKNRLVAHHIKKWEDYPEVRFELWNGITLCYKHHNQIKGQEEYYEEMFLRMTMK